MANQDTKFFMRFYGVDKEAVKSFLKTFKKSFPLVTKVTVVNLTKSVNMVVPPNSWEGWVHFKTMDDLFKVKNDPVGQAMYKNFSHPKGAKFVVQKADSPVYENPEEGNLYKPKNKTHAERIFSDPLAKSIRKFNKAHGVR